MYFILFDYMIFYCTDLQFTEQEFGMRWRHGQNIGGVGEGGLVEVEVKILQGLLQNPF